MKKELRRLLPKMNTGEILSELRGGPRGLGAKPKRTKNKGRDYPDVKLQERKEGLPERFLEDHGYEYSEVPNKPHTYTYTKDGKIKAFTPFDGNKSGLEVKTFNNPTLKQLRTWMQY